MMRVPRRRILRGAFDSRDGETERHHRQRSAIETLAWQGARFAETNR